MAAMLVVFDINMIGLEANDPSWKLSGFQNLAITSGGNAVDMKAKCNIAEFVQRARHQSVTV